MKTKFITIFCLPVIILLFGLACNLSGGPTPPREVKNSPEEAQSVETTIATVRPNPTTGKIQFTVTEAQMTSYVNQNLRQDVEANLKNPVIIFQPDRMELFGTITGDGINANGRVVMTVNIDDQGKPKVKITEANFGPIPVPSGLLSNLSTTIDRSLEDALRRDESNYRLESIQFATGTATVILRRK